MKIFKNFGLWFSILIFAFLFSYEPMLIRAQSIEDLNGIHERIGGNGDVESADNSDNYALYVVIGAIAVGVGLYFFLKWAEKKRPSKNLNRAEKEKSDKTKIAETEKSEWEPFYGIKSDDSSFEENFISP